MNAQEFEASLKAEGFTEIETKSYDPRPANGEHAHHFSVRGMVVEGAFTVSRKNTAVTYRPGETFAVAEGEIHFEEIGPGGARVMTGKKY
jgi:quercetin dioxygenase-like cupin family protein